MVCNDFELVSYSEIFQKANFKVFERRESEDKIDENLLAEHDIIISHDDMTPFGVHEFNTDIINLKFKDIEDINEEEDMVLTESKFP